MFSEITKEIAGRSLKFFILMSWCLFSLQKFLIFGEEQSKKKRKNYFNGKKFLPRQKVDAKKEATLPIENKQPTQIENNGPNVSSIQVLETFDNSPMRIPRVQAARPRPSTELDVSNYQVSEHDGSMIELRKGFQSRQSSVVEIRNGGTLSYINGA